MVFVLLAVVGLQIGEWLFRNVRGFLGLVFLAWLSSITIEPVVAGLHRRGWRRGMATALVLASAIALAVGFAALLGALLVDQLRQLVSAGPEIVDSVVSWVNLRFGTDFDSGDIAGSLHLGPAQTGDLARDLAPGLAGLISSLFGLVLQAFALILLTFYMSAEAPQLRRTIASWFPPRQQSVVATAWEVAANKAGHYVASKMLLAAISTVFTGIFFWLLGVPYWLPMAIWTGVFSQFVPTVGTYLAIAIPALVALAVEPIDAVWVVLFGAVYQQFENYLFAPHLTARTMSVHPAVGFSAAIAGAAVFGAVGALVSVPIVATMQALAETYGQRYEILAGRTEETLEATPDPAPP